MPVAAKLSRQFYDKLGDEVTNEPAEWLNQVDRRSVELEAKIESGLERIRSEMTSFKAELIKWIFLLTLAICQALR